MGNIRLFLGANDRLFINGAVLRTDRKVSIELLNNATFLLENHVLQEEQANTSIKQLYFVVQLLLMDPANSTKLGALFRKTVSHTLEHLENRQLIQAVKEADVEVSTGKVFTALKILRKLFPIEEEILNASYQHKAKEMAQTEENQTKRRA